MRLFTTKSPQATGNRARYSKIEPRRMFINGNSANMAKLVIIAIAHAFFCVLRIYNQIMMPLTVPGSILMKIRKKAWDIVRDGPKRTLSITKR
jgi:hypothetical protein